MAPDDRRLARKLEREALIPDELIRLPRVCPRVECGSHNVEFGYFNHVKRVGYRQPRFDCLGCGRQFTLGGRVHGVKEEEIPGQTTSSSPSLENANPGNSQGQHDLEDDETSEPSEAARRHQAFPTRPRSSAPVRAPSSWAAVQGQFESNSPKETVITAKLAEETVIPTNQTVDETPEAVNRGSDEANLDAQGLNPGRVLLKNSAKAHLLTAETTLRRINVNDDRHQSRRVSQRKRAELDQVLHSLKSALVDHGDDVHQTTADDVRLLNEISQGVANMRRQVEELHVKGVGLFKAMAAEKTARWVKDEVEALESIMNPSKVLLRGCSRR